MTDRPTPAYTRMLRVTLVLALLCASSSTVQAQIAVRSSLVDDRHVEAGTMYRGTVVLENLTDEPQQARLTVQDYRFSADGQNQFDQPGSHARSNAPWIELRPRILTLPPREKVEVSYEVQVPGVDSSGQALRGTYWSVVMVEPVLAGSAEATLPGTEEQHEFGVRQVTRFGVQVATHIRTADSERTVDDAGSAVSVAGAELAEGKDAPTLMVDVANEGTSLHRPYLQLEVYDSEGAVVSRTKSMPTRLYPNTSTRHRLGLDALPSGQYEALVIVHAGDERVVGAQYTLNL